jgi:hypothetical protein
MTMTQADYHFNMNTRPKEMVDSMVDFLRRHFDVDVRVRRRVDDIVIPRAALFNACKGYYSANRLGKFFGMNHATILHHHKNHDILMGIRQYRDIYAALSSLADNFEDMTISERYKVKNELEHLRNENDMLRAILERYVEVDKAMDEEKASREVREDVRGDVEMGKHQCDVSGVTIAMER